MGEKVRAVLIESSGNWAVDVRKLAVKVVERNRGGGSDTCLEQNTPRAIPNDED